MAMVKRPLQLKFICFLLLFASIIHIFLFLNILKEDGLPLIIKTYFDSLMIINLAALYGLWRLRKWAVQLIMLIAITQILSHTYLLLSNFRIDQLATRIIDIGFSIYFLVYFNMPKVSNKFK